MSNKCKKIYYKSEIKNTKNKRSRLILHRKLYRVFLLLFRGNAVGIKCDTYHNTFLPPKPTTVFTRQTQRFRNQTVEKNSTRQEKRNRNNQKNNLNDDDSGAAIKRYVSTRNWSNIQMCVVCV